jgi:hypothetical protein
MAAAAAVLVFSAILPIEQGADPGTAAPELVHAIPWILIVMLVGALGAFLFWWRHRRARRRRTETLSPPPGEIERRIAVELEAAIIRRVGDHTER